jgi:WD40 repeat protein
VETGLSCMSCHSAGLLPKDDQVRAHVLKNPAAFSREDRESILALYPPAGRLRGLLKEDNERFLHALGRAEVAPGEPEPVSGVALHYEATLDLKTAAAEVGLAAEEFTTRLRRFSELGRTLGPLLARGGTVQRQVFEETFAELARAFRLGTEGVPAATKPDLTWQGHRGSVRDVAFAPDGGTAASAGEDRMILVWEVPSGRLRARLEGHSDEVTAVAFAADGRRLLSGSRDRTVRLWDVGSGREVRRFVGHTDAVRAVALSADGSRAVSAGEDRTVRVWSVADGKECHCLTGHTGVITCLTLAPDGKLVLSGSEDGTLRRWDLETGRAQARWVGHSGPVYAVAFSADGRQALSGGNDRTLRLWDVATGKELRRLTGHANAVVRVAFLPGGRQALSASSQYQSADRILRRWDLAAGRELAGPPLALPERVECVAVAPSGRWALLGGGVLHMAALAAPP